MANISLSNIFFSYNNSDMLFTDLSCSVTNGAHVAIIGDNGTGKTTLLKIIAGFIVPDTGHVTINGECKYLGQFNTNKLKSGGQSQMDAIAAAFDSNADILLLDEPTNNLDPNARHEFYKKLRNYYGTVVIVSHDRELLNMMDTLMELRNGQIRLFGGNYDFYIKMKQSERNAIESKYVNTQKKITHLTTTKTLAQSMRHKHETKQAKDRANSANGSPIEANNLRGKSQETEAKRRKIIEKNYKQKFQHYMIYHQIYVMT
ncbi:MAG: ATP-binding cassette domain-containing protein [Alphaproteobacteria bacterium]|nr:ATP-binding cassette domain-containing protein [Alphaproteobacteria bacterium]